MLIVAPKSVAGLLKQREAVAPRSVVRRPKERGRSPQTAWVAPKSVERVSSKSVAWCN
jgi:hypothetical protein